MIGDKCFRIAGISEFRPNAFAKNALSNRKKLKIDKNNEHRSHEYANRYFVRIFLCAKAHHAYLNWYRNYLLHIELFSSHPIDGSLSLSRARARNSRYLFNLNVKNGWHDLYAIQLITIIECNFSRFHARMLSDGKCPKSCHQPISHHMSVLQIQIFPLFFSLRYFVFGRYYRCCVCKMELQCINNGKLRCEMEKSARAPEWNWHQSV